MNTQMIICMVIFAATLVSYTLNKIPMWLTAMISLAALYFTGCIDANGALAGFSNVNTLLMATMYVYFRDIAHVCCGSRFPSHFCGRQSVQRHHEIDPRQLQDCLFWLHPHRRSAGKLHRQPDGRLRHCQPAAGCALR